jgi:hypothetical protein
MSEQSFLHRTVVCYNEVKAGFFYFIEAIMGFLCELFLLYPYNFFATMNLFCLYETNTGFWMVEEDTCRAERSEDRALILPVPTQRAAVRRQGTLAWRRR